MREAPDRDPIEAAVDLPFLKVTGGGNDFILVDNRNGRLRGDIGVLVRLLCHRGFGVGADGMILVEHSARADLKMVYHNRDGGRADLCGNGVRCVARWAARSGSFPARLSVETGAGALEADGGEEPPWFRLPLGPAPPRPIALEVRGRRFDGTLVLAGVPHFVVETADAFGPNALDDAPALRSHPDLGAEGANVDFFTPRGGGRVDVRFFERGVEAETLSSGTGSIAVAAAAVAAGRESSPVRCRNVEGIESVVSIARGPGGMEATLAGEVRILYWGRIRREMLFGPRAGNSA